MGSNRFVVCGKVEGATIPFGCRPVSSKAMFFYSVVHESQVCSDAWNWNAGLAGVAAENCAGVIYPGES